MCCNFCHSHRRCCRPHIHFPDFTAYACCNTCSCANACGCNNACGCSNGCGCANNCG